LSADQTVRLPIAGRTKSGGATPLVAVNTNPSVVVNVTVTDPQQAGSVTVYPCAAPRPTASNLNFGAGQTIANLAIMSVDQTGALCLYSSAATHLIVDLNAVAERWTNVVTTQPFRHSHSRRQGSVRFGV
jgi:hypothetical protein